MFIIEASICGIFRSIAVEDGITVRPVDRNKAHRAGLAACIDLAAIQPEALEGRACISYRNDLGMCGRVVVGRYKVYPRCDDLAGAHDHRAKRTSRAGGN